MYILRLFLMKATSKIQVFIIIYVLSNEYYILSPTFKFIILMI